MARTPRNLQLSYHSMLTGSAPITIGMSLSPGLQPGQIYGYRADGPFAPKRGFRFDGEKVLLDPYGLVVAVPEAYDRQAATQPGDKTAVAMKSVSEVIQ